MKIRATLSLAASSILAGCASTSFAPPFVHTNAAVKPSQSFTCASQKVVVLDDVSKQTITTVTDPVSSDAKGTTTLKSTITTSTNVQVQGIPMNFRGARVLIENYRLAYQCAAHEAADGRQISKCRRS
jgi:hypothetical protein